MPRRLRNLPKLGLDLSFLREYLTPESYQLLGPDAPEQLLARYRQPSHERLTQMGQETLPFEQPVKFKPGLEEVQANQRSVFDSMEPIGYLDEDQLGLDLGGRQTGLLRPWGEGTFSERQPIVGRDPEARDSGPQLPQIPTKPDVLAEASRIARELAAIKEPRAPEGSIPTVGQPPPHLVDRLTPTQMRRNREGIGSAGVQKLYDQSPEAETWMGANESDLRFRENQARTQAYLKSVDRGVYDFDHGPGAWQREWDKTLVRPEALWAKEKMQLRAAPFYEAVLDPKNEALPDDYEAVEVPDGLGLTLNPEAKKKLWSPGGDPPTRLPHLGKITQEIQRKSGTGLVQEYMPSKVPWDTEIEKKVQELELEGRFDRTLLQPVWDRIHGSYFRDEEGARSAMFNFLDAILQSARDARLRQPGALGERVTRYRPEFDEEEQAAMRAHDAAMAAYTANRGFAEGVQSEGFAEREKKIDLSDNYAQLEEQGARELTSAEGFQANQADAEARDEFGRGTLQTLDVHESDAVGQSPLRALRNRKGAVLDQTENLRKGLVDLAIVPRGTVKVGHNRFGEPGLELYEAEVLKVIPLAPNMKPGFLEDVSRRLLLPTETLADAVASTRAQAVDGEMDFDLVQVRKPMGKVGPDLPPVGRTRHPDTFAWHAGDKGEAAKARLAKHPKIQELILGDVQGSVTRAVQGYGKQLLGVIYVKGKPVGVGHPDPRTGKYRFYRMTVDQASGYPTFRYVPEGPGRGQPYKGKPAANNIFENSQTKAELLIKGKETGRTPFFQEGDVAWTDPAARLTTRAPRAEDTVPGAMGKPLLEEEIQDTMPVFSRGLHKDESAGGGQPVVPRKVPVDPAEPKGPKRLETMEEAQARVLSQGVPRDIREVARQAGIELSPTPVREKISRGINWRLAEEPRKFDKGYTRAKNPTQSWPVAIDPSKADVTFVFTGRIPNKQNRNAITEYEPKPGSREIVNPTDEEVRHILQHSNITRAVVKVVEPDSLAEAQNLWHRATAVVNGATREVPRAGMRREIQKRGNPNWVEVGDIGTKEDTFLPVTGEKVAPSARTPQGGPALLGGGVEAEQLARIGKAQFERDPSPRGEQPLSRGERTEAENQALGDERIERAAEGALQPQTNPDAPRGRGFMDAIRAMHQRRGQEVVRKAFPEEKFGSGTGWGKKAWGIGLGTVGATLAQQILGGEETKAEASAGRAIKGKQAASAAAQAKMSEPSGDYVPGFVRDWMARHLNFFEPIYGMADEKVGGGAEQSLRNTFQTQHGGIVGQAEMRYEPIKLMRQKFDEAGQTENFTFFLKKAMNLKSWDNAKRRRDALVQEASEERLKGNGRKAQQLDAEAYAIDTQMAKGTLSEFGGTKDTEINDLRGLFNEVGEPTYKAFQRGAGIIYKQTQEMLDTLHAEGQIPDAEYAELKAQGVDFIPNVSTLFALQPDGSFRWTGGKHIKNFSVDSKGVPAKEILQTRFTDNILADPLTSVARFITESTAQIARTKMAQKVVDVFEPAGLAKQVDPNKNPTPELGHDFYTFMREGQPVTYELPKQLVEGLGMADQDFTNRFIQNLPGQQTLGALRSISEAGATTANLGWAALQGSLYDPVAAITQLPSKDRRIARRLIPFMGQVIKNLKDNLATANLGRASSPLRQKAARSNVLYAGSAADLADYSQIEGRDTSNRIGKAFEQGKYAEGINRGVRKGLGVLSDRFTKPLDEAVKMSAFDMMRKERAQGLNNYSDEEISYLVRTRGGSGDWNQRGSQDNWIRTLISFGRPAMIANETAIRSGYQQPRKLATVMASMLAAEGARQAMNSVAADQLGIPQEELEKRYSRYDQDNSLIFMIPPKWAKKMNNGEGMEIGANGIERPFAVKLPIPPLLRVWTSPLKGVAKAYQTGDWKDVVLGTPVGIADELLPGSVPLRYDSAGAAGSDFVRRLGSVLPAPYRLPIEQFADRQFFTGAPIVGSRLKDRAPTEQYSSSTEPFYKDLGRTTGFSPARLQHLGRGVAPGAFQLIPQIYNKLVPLPKDARGNTIQPVEQSPIERLNSLPLVGELTKRVTPQRYEEDLSTAQDQFYGLSNQTKSAAAAWNDYEQGVATDRPSPLSEYMARLNPDVQSLVRDLSEVSDAQKQVINSSTMTSREKRDKMRELLTIRRQALRQFLAIPQIQQVVGGQLPEQ